MDTDKYKNAPDAVTIKEAADILEIPDDWVAAKIDSGLPAYIVGEDSRLGLLSSLIPCEDEPTSLQDYYLATRKPRTNMKPYLIFCQYTLGDGTFIEEDLTHFDAIRILKKDLSDAHEAILEETESAKHASRALKALQTADIDKKIEGVIQVIDTAIRKHLSKKSKSMVVNHIRFLKEAGLGGKDRANLKVKEFIKKEYSGYGYSFISHAPPKNGDYFLSS